MILGTFPTAFPPTSRPRPRLLSRPRTEDKGSASGRLGVETLIRTLARAHRWKRLLEEGKFRSAAEIAAAEGVTHSFVNRLLRLTLLAPDIVEAILDGRQAKSLELAVLTDKLPSAWEEQRQLLPTTFARSALPRT